MNLPTRITFTNNRSIKYQYDAAGIKLRKVVDDGNHKITTYYMGGYQYQGDGEVKLQLFSTNESCNTNLLKKIHDTSGMSKQNPVYLKHSSIWWQN